MDILAEYSIGLFIIAFSSSLVTVTVAEEKYGDLDSKTQQDIILIETAVEKLIRPEIEGIPQLIQRLYKDSGITEYYFRGEQHAPLIKRDIFDKGKSVIIFSMGLYGFGLKANRSYIVLRKTSKSKAIYFMNIAYIRKDGKKITLEWSTIDKTLLKKTRIEKEICQADDCALPEWILGTCSIVEHNCSISDSLKGNNLNPSEYNNVNITKNTTSVRQKRRISAHRELNKTKQLEKEETNSGEPLVPSSLDLLLLTRSKNDNSSEDDSHFENSVPQVRGINNAHLDHQSLRCTECQTIGDYFEDLEEDYEFSKVLGQRVKEEFSSSVYLKLDQESKSIIDEYSKIPYIGYGKCNYSQGKLDKPTSKEIDDMVEFYLGTLRMDCDTEAQAEARGWLTSKFKFLEIEPDLTLHLKSTSQLLTSEMLSGNEFEMLISALLFSTYTEIYHEETVTPKPSNLLNPVKLSISKRTDFFTKLLLRTIENVYRLLYKHLVKAIRSLIRFTKDKFLVLLREKLGIGRNLQDSYEKQMQQTQENYNDRQQVMALKEFTLYGLGPIFKSATDPNIAFDSFYKLNGERIKFLVDSYNFDTYDEEKTD